MVSKRRLIKDRYIVALEEVGVQAVFQIRLLRFVELNTASTVKA